MDLREKVITKSLMQCCFAMLLVMALNNKTVLAQGYKVEVPASPNASSLGEYGNTPISLANGTPNISVPIYEIKGRHLSLPISLSYRASGIKVEEISSHVGLGWSLNAGGVIARAIAGKPDEGINPTTGQLEPGKHPDITLPYIQDNTNNSEHENQYIALKLSDLQPDTYFYNFLGYSGRFVFDYDGTPIIAPDQNFKIEFPFPEGYFIITDDKGIRYYFNNREVSYGNDENGYYRTSAPTSWYLSKVESADLSETITFQYEPEEYIYYSPSREVILVNGSTKINLMSSRGDWTTIEGWRLSGISTNFGYSVNFLPGVVRKDVQDPVNAYSIGEIRLLYDNICFKSVFLNSAFVETKWPFSKSGTPYYQQDMEWTNYRLYLNSVSFEDCSSQEYQNYEFSYYGIDSDGKDELPNRMSFAQDHWGYYNGYRGRSNQTLRPRYEGYFPDGEPGEIKVVPGAFREAVFPDMQYGTLNSITYPTGGRTEFVFEPHEGGKVYGGLRIQKILDYEGEEILREREYTYSSIYVSTPDYTYGGPVYYRDGVISKDLHPHCIECYPNWMDCTPHCYNNKNFLRITSGSPIALGTTHGYHVSYGVVREIEKENGYTKYTYTNMPNFYNGDSEDKWLYAPEVDNSWKRGLLLSKEVYKERVTRSIEKTVIEYDFNALKDVHSVVWSGKNYGTILGTQYYSTNYKVTLGVPRIKKKTLRKDEVISTITNEYDQSNYLSKVKEISSENQTIETFYQYPESPEFINGTKQGSNLLRENNIFASVLRTTKKVNGIDVYKQEKTYAEEKGHMVLKKISDYPNGKLSGLLEQVINYNESGRPSSIENPGEMKASYQWGYHNTLPVAEVRGSQYFFYENFESNGNSTKFHTGKKCRAGDYTVDFQIMDSRTYILNYWYLDGESWKFKEEKYEGASRTLTLGTHIDDVRIHPLGTQMTTYTYDPADGLTSVSDENNQPQYYYYDSFGRLIYIKDSKSNILQHFVYHYKE